MRVVGFFLLFAFQVSFCQNDSTVDYRFIRPVVTSHTNFHKSLNSDSSAFQQEKLTLGINYGINKYWTGKFWVDVLKYGDENNPQRLTPYIKPGFISYHKNELRVDAGIFFGSQTNDQLFRWGNRYMHTMFQCKQNFGWIADLGVRAKYEVFSNFLVEAGVQNGDGYKNIGFSLPLKWTGSIYYMPTDHLFLKIYSDTYKNENLQSSLATFLDYRKDDKYSFSLEYNYKWNYLSMPGHDRYGLSAYSTLYFLERFALISRVDKLYLKNIKDENLQLYPPINEILYLVGLQIQPLKQIRMAIDYQYWGYYERQQQEDPWFYVHLEYKIM